MIPLVRENVERALRRISITPPLSEDDIDQATAYAEAVMLDWMGTGGDLFFLDMFILANQCLPGMLIRAERRFEAKRDYLSDRRRTLAYHLRLYCQKRKVDMSSTGFVPYAGGVADDRNDEVFCRMTDLMTGEHQEDMLIEQRVAAMEFPNRNTVLVLTPLLSFRTDLMGELAQPWENLPPPYGVYELGQRP